ncbi:MurR/RpiR family transcriptional regulator [Aerococcaceae bacterium WGS1372]
MKSIESLYNKNYHKMSQTDLYIFDYIMRHVEEVSGISITQLSEELAVSKSTISRFTQKNGFSGFSEFKFFLSNTLHNPESDKTEKSIDRVMDDMEATFKLFKQANLKKIVEALYDANDIFCYGTGWGQKTALDDLRRSMILCNKYTIDISARTELQMVSRTTTDRDVLIIASLSGDISSIEDQLNIFKSRGAVIIAITSIQASSLARMADYTIYFQTLAIPYHKEDMVSFLPVNQVTNLLFLEYFDYFRQEELETIKDS